MVLGKSVLMLLGAVVGLRWVQAFPERRGEINHPRQFGDVTDQDTTIQDDNDNRSIYVTAPTTSETYKSNKMAILQPTRNGLSEAAKLHSLPKSRLRLSLRASLKLVDNLYKANDEIEAMQKPPSSSDRDILINLRQTLCNVVSGVEMPLDVQVIQNVKDVICAPLFSNNARAMYL